MRRDGATAAGTWTAADQRALEAWLAASTAHLVAFLRLEAAWERAKRLKPLGAGMPADQVPAPEAWHLASGYPEAGEGADEPAACTGSDEAAAKDAAPVRSRRRRVSWALAAGLLLAVAAAWMWPLVSGGPVYRTPVGGLASIPMSDGSRITLNSESEVRIRMTANERRVFLDQGEAYFEVRRDPSRSFVVVAGTKRVVAVGTAFSVRRGPEGLRVVVTEGKVKVESAGPLPIPSLLPEQARDGAPAVRQAAMELAAGAIAEIRRDSNVLDRRSLPDAEDEVSWRTGYLVFRDTRLADAVAEFNRYNTRKIRLADAEVAELRLSGKFQSTQYEAFVRLLERDFPVRAAHTKDGIRLSAQ